MPYVGNVLIILIKTSISQLKGKRISTKYLFRLSQQLGFSTLNVPMDTLVQWIIKEKKEYEKLKQNHKENRLTYLEELAESLAEANKTSQLSELTQLQNREEQRSIFRRIKRLKGENNLATTFVRVNENGTSRDITDQREMEDAIIPINCQKFHQSEESCPFLRKPLLSAFGYHGEGPAMSLFQKGQYQVPPEVDEYTTEFINICQQQQQQFEDFSHMKRTAKDFMDSWKKMTEKTSSRELHFGHFKASCNDNLITVVNYILSEIPFQTGYSPIRWRNATDVMILKKIGLYDVNKLRTIVLYEADFNHNNKFLGKTMMNFALRQKKMAPE